MRDRASPIVRGDDGISERRLMQRGLDLAERTPREVFSLRAEPEKPAKAAHRPAFAG